VGKFDSFTLTRKGALLMGKIVAGQKLTFTHCAIGDGEIPYGTNLCDLTALINQKMLLPITSVSIKSAGNAIVRFTYDNHSVTTEFYVREIGLFANEPDAGEILYAVANAGDNADLLPAYGGAEVVEQIYDIIALIGNADSATAVIDDSLIYATAQDLKDHENDQLAHPEHRNDRYAHMDLIALHLWRPGKAYAVGDICYSPYAASYKRFECVMAGTSGPTEPTWPDVGQMVMDNTVQWIVDDIRDGTPVGRSVLEHRANPRLGYLKKNGALLKRADYPRLWAYAQDSGLLVSDTQWAASMMGCFSTGDGSTTFRIPDGRAEFDRAWDDSRGIDLGRVLGSEELGSVQQHNHYLPTSTASATNPRWTIDDIYWTWSDANTGPRDEGPGAQAKTSTYPGGPDGIGTETRPRNIALLACLKY
jgi:phage-related tail fiber protein